METAKKETVQTVKSIYLEVHEVEQDAIIVNVDGWRIRVYFDDSFKNERRQALRFGNKIEVSYTGDLNKVHTLKFEKLK